MTRPPRSGDRDRRVPYAELIEQKLAAGVGEPPPRGGPTDEADPPFGCGGPCPARPRILRRRQPWTPRLESGARWKKGMIDGGFAPLLDERGGGAADYAERRDCPGHRSAGRGLFPGRRQREESNDEEEHDLPV